jgi:hypothetical protein
MHCVFIFQTLKLNYKNWKNEGNKRIGQFELTHIFICNEKPIFPHEFSNGDDASRYHSAQEDDEDTTKIG